MDGGRQALEWQPQVPWPRKSAGSDPACLPRAYRVLQEQQRSRPPPLSTLPGNLLLGATCPTAPLRLSGLGPALSVPSSLLLHIPICREALELESPEQPPSLLLPPSLCTFPRARA